MKSFILTNLILLNSYADSLPNWISKGVMSDSSFHYVVCSHDGIDPEEARQIAESKCLASAAKLGGVNVKLTQKTVQSLTGSDSSEVAEIEPLQSYIKCEWTDRFLEKIKDGFRVWLRCKVLKRSLVSSSIRPVEEKSESIKAITKIEAMMILTAVPKPDRVVVKGIGGERVIEPSSNSINILISELDRTIELRKNGYKSLVVELPKNLKHGDRLQKGMIFEKE